MTRLPVESQEFIANLTVENSDDSGSNHSKAAASDTTLELRQRATLEMAKAGIP